jgi:hypothetical protein
MRTNEEFASWERGDRILEMFHGRDVPRATLRLFRIDVALYGVVAFRV